MRPVNRESREPTNLNLGVRLGRAVLCLAMLPACVGVIDRAGSSASSRNLQKPGDEFMRFISDVETFLGAAQVVLRDDDASSPRLVADRILTGFEQYPSSHLLLDNGSAIYWGWQHGQAFVRSLAVYNSARQLEMVAAVDDIPLLSGQRTGHAVVGQQGYQQLLRRHASWGSSPAVVLFARNNQAVATHYPLVKRWVQAAMLGFNADCSKPDLTATCGFVEQIAIPTVAYSLNCGGAETVNRCPLSLPDVPAARIGLQEFRQ